MAGIVKYAAESGNEVKLSLDTVRKYISDNPNVTDQEFMAFAALCKAHRLDPFIRECYLIKYGNQPAQITVSKDVYCKRAFRNPRFRGYKAGVTVINRDGAMERREGSMVGGKTEKLIGGWCSVYIEGYEAPMYDEVSFEEYAGRKKDGSLNQMWATKPGTMIRKVAIAHALREAFPEDLAGMYDAAEFGGSEPVAPPVEAAPEIVEEAPPVEYFEAEGGAYEEQPTYEEEW